ncbi:MAG: hypothetical protein ACLUI3_04540 [Christensenellales bacterium]
MKKILAFALALAMILTCSLALADRLDDIKAAGKRPLRPARIGAV